MRPALRQRIHHNGHEPDTKQAQGWTSSVLFPSFCVVLQVLWCGAGPRAEPVPLSAAADPVGGLAEANGSKRKQTEENGRKRKHLEASGSIRKNELERPNRKPAA